MPAIKKYRTNEDYINKAIDVHGKYYIYDKTVFKKLTEKIIIGCPKHGYFEQRASSHLLGQGCSKCVYESRKSNNVEFIRKAINIHGLKYDYSKTNYVHSEEKLTIICPIHGPFQQQPSVHLSQKSGCPKCGNESMIEKLTSTTEEFIEKAVKIHGLKYDYSESEYIGAEENLTIICPLHGPFQQQPQNHLSGKGCPSCACICSKQENELIDWIKSNFELVRNSRNIINPLELDIYIPEKKIAIEYNGLYWHNENQKDKDYHLLKTESCLKKGIRLIHIFEDEWIRKPEIVKSRLLNIFGKSKYRFYARKCDIREVPVDIEKIFLDKNHIQGYTKSIVCYGLYLNNILISIMSFSNKRKSTGYTPIDGDYELLRFCNFKNFSVVGAASKLLKHFIKVYKPNEIISFCDRRWSEGDLYEKLGFTFSHNSIPSYFYIVNGERKHRYGFRKSELIRKYNCPETMSEKEFCFQNKWYRIYDCGTKLYILDCSKLNM